MKLETSANLDSKVGFNERSQSSFVPQVVTHTAQIPVSNGLFYTNDYIWAPSPDAFSIFYLPKPSNIPVQSTIYGSCLAIQYNGFFSPATINTNEWPLYLTIGEIKSGTGSLFEPLLMWELPALHFNRASGIFTHTISELPQFEFDWTMDRMLGACVCYDGELKTFQENEDITNGQLKASITIGQITKGLI